MADTLKEATVNVSQNMQSTFKYILADIQNESTFKDIIEYVINSRANNDLLIQLKVEYNYSDILEKFDFRVKIKFGNKFYTTEHVEGDNSLEYKKIVENEIKSFANDIAEQLKEYGLIGLFNSAKIKEVDKDKYTIKFDLIPKVIVKNAKKNDMAKYTYDLLLAKDPNIVNEEDVTQPNIDTSSNPYGKLTTVLNEYFNYDCENDIAKAFETYGKDTIKLNVHGYKWNEKYDDDEDVVNSLSINVIIKYLGFSDFGALNKAIAALNLPYPYTKEQTDNLLDNMSKFTDILANQIRTYGYNVKTNLTPEIGCFDKSIVYEIYVSKKHEGE